MENSKHIMNSSITTGMIEEDYFKELYTDTILKKMAILFFFAGTIFGLMLELGIIWYERNGNHRYRTVINQLFSTISLLVVAYILFVYIPEGIRYFIGPLDATYCDVHNFLKDFIWNCTFLTLDCIILLRYIFIFNWKSFAVVNDDLITCFLQLTILVVGLWISVVKRFSLGKMSMNYFMCAGINPDGENANNNSEVIPKKFDTCGLLICISFVLHIFVFAKIFLYQREMERKMIKIKLGSINSSENIGSPLKFAWENGCQNRSSNMPKSMADLLTQILCLTFLTGSGITVFVMNKMSSNELNEYQNRWIVYWNQLVGEAVAVLGISATYYTRNPSVSKGIWRHLRENFGL